MAHYKIYKIPVDADNLPSYEEVEQTEPETLTFEGDSPMGAALNSGFELSGLVLTPTDSNESLMFVQFMPHSRITSTFEPDEDFWYFLGTEVS